MRVVCLVCLVVLGVLSGVHGRTIQAAKNDGGPSVAIKRGSRPKIPSAKNPLPEMIFTTNNRAGYGNQVRSIPFHPNNPASALAFVVFDQSAALSIEAHD